MSDLNSILNELLPGYLMSDSKYRGSIATVDWEGEKILIFDSYEAAERFNDERYLNYLDANPQQAIYLWELYLNDEEWKKHVRTKSLGKWLVENFDRFTNGKFKHSPYRERTLKEIEENPIEHLIVCTNGDLANLSTQIFQFLRLKDFIPELQDAMESRIYEHGGYFMLPLVELPVKSH